MIIVSAISFIVLFTYIVYNVVRFGMPTSVSATYYNTTNKWLFPAVIITSAALLLVPMLELYQGDFQFLSFIAASSMIFVGCSPAFREDFVGRVHSVAATLLFLSALPWVIINDGFPYLFLASIVIALFNRKSWLFWAEVGLMFNVYKVLLL